MLRVDDGLVLLATFRIVRGRVSIGELWQERGRRLRGPSRGEPKVAVDEDAALSALRGLRVGTNSSYLVRIHSPVPPALLWGDGTWSSYFDIQHTRV